MTLTAAETSLPTGIPKHDDIDLVFVSGPTTGIARCNYPAFKVAAASLRAAGYSVLCPAENGHDTSTLDDAVNPVGFDLRTAFADYAVYICTEADAIAVLPGWEHSPGARGEVALALAIGLPILDAATGHHLDVTLAATAQVSGQASGPGSAPAGVAGDPTPAPPTSVDALAVLALDERGEVDEIELDRTIARHPAGKAALAAGREPISIEETPKRPDLTVVPRQPVTAPDTTPAPAPVQAPTVAVSGEVRSVSATGGQKGVKEARFDLIPAGVLWELAVHFGRGNLKYPDEPGQPPNWMRGYEWSNSIAALERHLGLFKQGEDYDPEMGTKHVIAVAWHAFVLAWFMENFPDFDDRQFKNGQVGTYRGALPTPQYILDLVASRTGDAAQIEGTQG